LAELCHQVGRFLPPIARIWQRLADMARPSGAKLISVTKPPDLEAGDNLTTTDKETQRRHNVRLHQ